MRVLILGGTGMLGHQLIRAFSPKTETWATTRTMNPRLEAFGLQPTRQVAGVRLEDGDLSATLARVLDECRPDIVVNAVGALKPTRGGLDPLEAINLNSVLPWTLARLCETRGSRVVAISTDCVFSGSRGYYSESDIPDAEDLYGRTKLLGELAAPHLTIRTSIIGRELSGERGLVEWFLAQTGRVMGYRSAVFSGLPTVVLAGMLSDLILDRSFGLEGLFHIAAEPIDKYSLLGLLNDAFETGTEITPNDDFILDRSLDGSQFAARTGFRSPAWPELVEVMVEDACRIDYVGLRAKGGRK